MDNIEMAALVVAYLVLNYGLRRRFWNPIGGAPTVLSERGANAITRARIDVLRAAGQAGNALGVAFGSILVPLEVLNKPTLLVGLPGCGKTTFINAMFPWLFALFIHRTGRTRFVFLDVKNELPRRLHALVPKRIPIHYLNPLDARGSVLDFPKIFVDRSDIDQLAHTLCPATPGDQTPFFRNAARYAIGLVATVLQNHRHQATRPWGLLELCSILADKRSLKRVMALDFEAKTFYRATLGVDIKSAGDVFATIRAVIQPLIPAALAERHHPPRFGLKTFLRDDGVAILGLPPTGFQAVLPVFNVLIRRLVEEAQTISHPEDRLFLVLDEIAMLDRAVVESIVKATCIGRSHGIHVIAATQSIELLEAQLGRDQAQAFLSSCTNVVGFRCGSRKTAEYIVGRMGNQEGIILLTSNSSSKDGGSTSVSEQLQSRPTVMVEELLHLPLADAVGDRMEFIAVSPAFGTAKVACTFIKETTVETDSTFPNTSPRSSGPGLCVLSESDFQELGFPKV